MKKTINLHQFREAFRQMRPDNFTYQGLAILFDYLEQCEEDMSEEIEFNIIAICCDFSEDSWQTIAKYYNVALDETADDEENADSVRDFLQDEGAFIGESVNGCFVYRAF